MVDYTNLSYTYIILYYITLHYIIWYFIWNLKVWSTMLLWKWSIFTLLSWRDNHHLIYTEFKKKHIVWLDLKTRNLNFNCVRNAHDILYFNTKVLHNYTDNPTNWVLALSGFCFLTIMFSLFLSCIIWLV